MSSILNSIGIVQGQFQVTSLVSPYDNPLLAFQNFLATAAVPGAKLRTIIYGATLDQYFSGLEAAKKAGCDVRVLFDHTQAEGRFEKPQIEALSRAGFVDGTDFLIGTSPDHHEILHQKSTTIWAPGKIPLTLTGSWNYSNSATKEANNFFLVESEEIGAQQDAIFQAIWAWVHANEPQYQTL